MKDCYTKFEGPEKKLEIILATPYRDLRSNEDGRWNKVVKASRAEIISKACAGCVDAYLLSESSLFVWDDRILLITCGRTTLTAAVPEILDIVRLQDVGMVFYERKNLLYPEEQPWNFEDDVALLLKYFPGKSYRLGPANYDHVHVFYSSLAETAPQKDATLQILMHDLAPHCIDLFSARSDTTPSHALARSGLDQIYPAMKTDSYLFSPYGFSMNGIQGASYFTVHVTPELGGSYASFEANVIAGDYRDLIDRIVSIFRPERFSVVLTTSSDPYCLSSHRSLSGAVKAYRATEKSLYEFDCGYVVTFLNYVP